MNIRRLSRIVMLTGLVLTLTACTGSPAPQAEHPPTVSASTLTSTAQLSPTPSPSPFGGASAQLGSLPLTCPSSSIHMPKTISPKFAPAVGAGPAWGVGIISYQQMPLALVWDPGSALTTHEEYGWGHKLLWVVATHL